MVTQLPKNTKVEVDWSVQGGYSIHRGEQGVIDYYMHDTSSLAKVRLDSGDVLYLFPEDLVVVNEED